MREISISEGTSAISFISDKRYIGDQRNKENHLYGRVIDIALSVADDLFIKTNTLESILFEPIQEITTARKSGDESKKYLIAFKSHPSVRTPIINEIVLLNPAPDINIQNINSQYSQVFYYNDPISIFGAIEHNAAPDNNTLINLTDQSQVNRLDNYQKSTTGISPTTNATDTVVKKDQIRLGNYYKEQGIKQLSPLEGDLKIEGRFGNSIRFGGSPSEDISKNTLWKGSIGSPILILRNGQRKIDSGANIASLFEDINEDGSSFYLMQHQTIELILASDNFDSYNQNFDNSIVKSQIITGPPRLQPTGSSFTDDLNNSFKEIPTNSITGSVVQGSGIIPNDLDNIPDNEDDFNFVQLGEDIPVPITQGVVLNKHNTKYVFNIAINNASVFNKNLIKSPRTLVSAPTRIAVYAGLVSNVPGITKNGKALLDLISLAEGTLGAGNFNGYDVIVGGFLVPGFDNYTASPAHPNLKVFIPDYNVYSTATGRYQFTILTWNLIAGQTTSISKLNQDIACWKNILQSANVPLALINQIDSNKETFKKVISMMAQQWASLPVINDPKGLYAQAGRFSFDTLYSYFLQILSKYQ